MLTWGKQSGNKVVSFRKSHSFSFYLYH